MSEFLFFIENQRWLVKLNLKYTQKSTISIL